MNQTKLTANEFLEFVYKLYEQSLAQESSEEYIQHLADENVDQFQTSNIDFDLISKEILSKINSEKENNLEIVNIEENFEIKPYQIYLKFEDNIIIYYCIIDKLDNYYEVLKVSQWKYLAAQNDLLFYINGEGFILETWNRFYLLEHEIKEDILYAELPNDVINLLEKALNGEEIPIQHRGITVDLNNEKYVQTKFHRKEAEIVSKYSQRLFTDILSDEDEYENETNVYTIFVEPNELKDYFCDLLAASTKKCALRGNGYFINYNQNNNKIEIHLPKFHGRKGTISILNKSLKFASIPEIIEIQTTISLSNVDLENISKTITINLDEL